MLHFTSFHNVSIYVQFRPKLVMVSIFNCPVTRSILNCKLLVKTEIYPKFTVISSLIITINDRSIIYADTIHSATLSIDTSPMFDPRKLIF